MDIKCATCQEPWDAFHMSHDAVNELWDGVEGSSSQMLAEKFLSSDRASINDMLREDFKAEGWEFGRTVFAIMTCPCCAGNAGDAEDKELVSLRKELRIELEELMGTDVDGIISGMTSIDAYASME